VRWKLAAGGCLAVLGGLLMAGSGFATRGLLYLALGYAENEIPSVIPGPSAGVALVAVAALQLVIALGGIAVAVGGVLMLSGHPTLGRTLVFLGGGAGFLGLAVSFGYTAYSLGWTRAVGYAPYWLGLALAASSRRLARPPR
jgi:hypothetical protein